MTYETLDDGTPLTDEAVDTLVAGTYAAPEKGAYTVIPNPHKPERGSAPLKLTGQRRSALLRALEQD